MMTGQDVHGRPKNAIVDDDSGCLGAIDIDHIKIHEGEAYDAMARLSIPSGGTVYGYLETTDKEIHWKPSGIRPSADKLYLEFYKNQTKVTPTPLVYDPVTRLGGIPPQNSNQGSSKTSSVIIGTVAAPTLIGLPFAALFLPGASGVGQTREGASTQQQNEIDLKPNTAYIYKIYNGSTTTNIVDLQFHWYETAEGV